MSLAATAHTLFATRPRAVTLVDVAIALVTFAGTLALLSRHGIPAVQSEPGELDRLGVVLAGCSTLPLVAWRRAARDVFVITAASAVLMGGLGYTMGLPLGATAALYLLAASRDDSDPWTAGRTGLVLALFFAFLGATAIGDGRAPASELLHTGLAWAVAWFAGERTRLRREHIAELEDRARRAHRDAERERRLAVAEERARIARDLHDSAGHSINVIAVRAGAARMRFDEDPERSRAALEAIEELARQTVGEIDQMVGTLRDHAEQGEVAPPGLASLETLLAHHSAAGLDVTLSTRGSSRELGAPVDRAAYRILQEALTNAARHGTGSARISLVFAETGLDLSVINPVPGDAPPRANGTHGLTGMSERASLLGGQLEADRSNGAFHLRAHLPYRGDPR